MATIVAILKRRASVDFQSLCLSFILSPSWTQPMFRKEPSNWDITHGLAWSRIKFVCPGNRSPCLFSLMCNPHSYFSSRVWQQSQEIQKMEVREDRNHYQEWLSPKLRDLLCFAIFSLSYLSICILETACWHPMTLPIAMGTPISPHSYRILELLPHRQDVSYKLKSRLLFFEQ